MILNPFSGIPASERSHVRGWSLIWSELLHEPIAVKGQSLLDERRLVLDHSVNFGGSMNLFGGVTGEMIDTLTELCMFDGSLWSLDIPMPNYVEQLEKRIGQVTCHPALKDLLPQLKERFSTSNTLTMAELEKSLVAIGDSHSSAFSPKGSAVLRTNGATLYGAIKNKSIQAQMDALGYSPKRVTLVYGSIDIRHHIGRQQHAWDSVKGLCQSYSDTIKAIQDDYLCEVEVAAPVPVEHEERKLPKTGYYKDAPFAGRRQDRAEWTMLFIDRMRSHGHKIVMAPAEWYLMGPEEYAKTYMEMGGSVPIAPKYYRRYSKWDES